MNKEIVKAILRAQIAIEDHGDPDKALGELKEIPQEIISDQLTQELRWARRELESGDINLACESYLNAALDLAMDSIVEQRKPASESPYTDGLRARLAAYRQGGVV